MWWRSVGFLVYLLVFWSSAHDVKRFHCTEDDLHNSRQHHAQESACYRNGNPDKCNTLTVICDIQNFRKFLATDMNGVTFGRSLSPSISSFRSSDFLTTNVDSKKLTPYVNTLSSLVAPPAIFSRNLPLKMQKWPFSSANIHPPRRYVRGAQAVQMSMNQYTPNHFLPRPSLDHRQTSGTSKSSNSVFLPVTFKNGKPMSSASMNNIPPLVSPFRITLQESSGIEAPYSFILSSSPTTEIRQSVPLPSLPYNLIRLGSSLPPVQSGQSQERKYRRRYTHALSHYQDLQTTGPSSIPSYYGQPHNLLRTGSYASEYQPSVGFVSPFNGSPLAAYYHPQGPSMKKIQPPKVAPPLLLSPPPPTLKPPMVSRQDHQHQMHSTLFPPVVPKNPTDLSTKWLPPRAQVQPPVTHSWTSVPPSGIGNPSPNNLPSEPQEAPPPMISPSHGHRQNVQSPVASPASIFPSRPIREKPSISPLPLPGNRSKRSSPVTLAPKYQGDGSPPPTSLPSEPLAPLISPSYGPIASPQSIFPSAPTRKKPSIPSLAPPRKRLKRHSQVTWAPKSQGINYPPPTNLPSEPLEAPAPMISPSEGRHQNVPGVFPSGPTQEKPNIPPLALPMNRLKRQSPVTLAPKNQGIGHAPSTNISSEPRVEPAPLISPSHGHHQNVQSSVASPQSIFPFGPTQENPSIPPLALPRKRSKGQSPLTLAPKNQGIGYAPPTNISSEPRVAPAPLISPSHGHHQNVQGSVASPQSIFPFGPTQENPSIPSLALPWHRSKRKSPLTLAPKNQGMGYSPTNLPSEPLGALAPLISPSHGPIASPQSISPSAPTRKKPDIPSLAPPRNRLKRHSPVTWAPKSQGINYTPPTNLPSEPLEAPAPMISPSEGHDQNVPGIFPFGPMPEKPNIPPMALPRNRLKRQSPVTLAPKNQGIGYASPTNISSEPRAAPAPQISPSHEHHQNMQGSVASPQSIFPFGPTQENASIPPLALPRNGSKRQSPLTLAPKNQGIGYPPPTELPSEPQGAPAPLISTSHGHHQNVQGIGYPPLTNLPSEPQGAPAPLISTSYGHHQNVRGPVGSPQNSFPSRPAQKKPSVPHPALPKNGSKRISPVSRAPGNQGIGYPSPTNLPSEPREALPPKISPFHGHNQKLQVPMASPLIIASQPPQKMQGVHQAPSPTKRPGRHVPVGIPSIHQGSVPSQLTFPSGPPKVNPGISFAPSTITPMPQHHWGVKGPFTSPPSKIPSQAPQKIPNIPIAAAPSKRSGKHTPVASIPTAQGPTYSPVNSAHPSSSRNLRSPTVSPSIIYPSPPHHRPQEHAPVTSPPATQGPVYSSLNSPNPSSSGNLGAPIAAPPTIIPSPHHQSWKRTPVASPPLIQGPVYSSVRSPHPSSSGNLRTPTVSPSVIFPYPPHHRSRQHVPVASPPLIQGPVYSSVRSPHTSSGNLRTPTVSPSVIFPSPRHHQSQKHAPVSSPLLPQGPVYPPVKSPHPSSYGNLITPTVSPSVRFPYHPHHRSQQHVPVASPPFIQGPVYSLVRSPHPSSSGNLRTPTVSPSVIFPPPRHHQSQKHAPVSSPHLTQGPIYPPVKSPHPSSSGNLRTPTVSPSVIFPYPPHHRTRQHVPVASPPLFQGPVYSPIKSPQPSSSGKLGTPTVSPSVIFPSPPHYRSWKHAPAASPSISQGPAYSSVKSPHASPIGNPGMPAASPLNMFPLTPHQGHTKGSLASPNISPSEPPEKTPTIPVAAPPIMFPPPPPRQDCSLTCPEPYTSTPPGSPCGCVNPMQVELGLGVALYAFFPLVSELAKEIAAGTFLKQSQVRIMGANASIQDQENTIVNLDLVPLGDKFDNTTAFLIFERFWQKKVMINETLFGDYWVIQVQYSGLPPSPPSNSNPNQNGVPDVSNSGPTKVDPLGVDINKRSDKMGAGTIAVVALSSAIAVIICLGTLWIVLLKCRNQNRPTSAVAEPTHVSSITKRSGTGGGSVLSGSIESSTSMSLASSMATYTGSAKTFTSAELEKATDGFNRQNILGEGGFGRVYRGVLEDGTKVAVKVLTRDDQQGGREFIAEVEMLSRLHHRNLVKLIGICAEEHNRCLVYELVSNGSVESHLHGPDKETSPLDWDARIKIALGAARGLAYLHEDSSPRVIHRDFKASNILLEDDFTPKVSDFGLAKSASEEVSGHISTRVMGTFGYVAPEYAMTGHLLVKSDVYSYGVVLLELLSGKKPVDMSQPPGQENLVTWARPLLTSKEGLEALIDLNLGSNLPFDNVAKVAAIASMCTQPEHSHRPFMGEVVQALKLVYNDSDASNGGGSGSFSRGESSAHETEVKDSSGQPWYRRMQYVPESASFVTIDYDSGPLETQGLEVERPLSASALMSTSGRFIGQLSGSLRRHCSSGPLRTNRRKESWYGIRGLTGGSISEHGINRHFGRGSDGDVHEFWQ